MCNWETNMVEQMSEKSICFDFKAKGKNFLTLTVIIDLSSKCQVLFQIKKIKYKFKHNGWFENKERERYINTFCQLEW